MPTVPAYTEYPRYLLSLQFSEERAPPPIFPQNESHTAAQHPHIT